MEIAVDVTILMSAACDDQKGEILWEKEAARYGADPDRVQVWDAFSELYLDGFRTDAELKYLAELIADSPFCSDELEHILLWEVAPICAPNFFN